MHDTDKPSRKSFDQRLKRMVDRLRADILEGLYKPGDYLPSEKQLTEQFQLSNKSVRKGLTTLSEEGLIVKIDRVGSRVTESAAGAAVTLTLGFTHSIERDVALTALLDDFQTLYPAIRVKQLLVQSPSNYLSAVKTYSDNGLIDLFTLNNTDFQELLDDDDLHWLEHAPIDPALYRFSQDAFAYSGERYAWPLVFSPIILAYNREHFRDSGVPEPDGSWTWKDAIHHAKKLTVTSKRHGLYFYPLSDNRWPAFLLQSGERFEFDGSFRLDDSRMLSMIQLCKQIITDKTIFPSYMSESSKDVNELFEQGKVSMMITNYMTMNEFRASSLDYDISPLPYLYEQRSLLNVIGVAISTRSRHPDAARKLAEYLASERAHHIIRRQTLSLPACKAAAEAPHDSGEAMNRPSRYYLFREIMASYRLHRELNLSAAGIAALRQLLKKYWSGLIDERELCTLSLQLSPLSAPRGGHRDNDRTNDGTTLA